MKQTITGADKYRIEVNLEDNSVKIVIRDDKKNLLDQDQILAEDTCIHQLNEYLSENGKAYIMAKKDNEDKELTSKEEEICNTLVNFGFGHLPKDLIKKVKEECLEKTKEVQNKSFGLGGSGFGNIISSSVNILNNFSLTPPTNLPPPPSKVTRTISGTMPKHLPTKDIAGYSIGVNSDGKVTIQLGKKVTPEDELVVKAVLNYFNANDFYKYEWANLLRGQKNLNEEEKKLVEEYYDKRNEKGYQNLQLSAIDRLTVEHEKTEIARKLTSEAGQLVKQVIGKMEERRKEIFEERSKVETPSTPVSKHKSTEYKKNMFFSPENKREQRDLKKLMLTQDDSSVNLSTPRGSKKEELSNKIGKLFENEDLLKTTPSSNFVIQTPSVPISEQIKNLNKRKSKKRKQAINPNQIKDEKDVGNDISLRGEVDNSELQSVSEKEEPRNDEVEEQFGTVRRNFGRGVTASITPNRSIEKILEALPEAGKSGELDSIKKHLGNDSTAARNYNFILAVGNFLQNNNATETYIKEIISFLVKQKDIDVTREFINAFQKGGMTRLQVDAFCKVFSEEIYNKTYNTLFKNIEDIASAFSTEASFWFREYKSITKDQTGINDSPLGKMDTAATEFLNIFKEIKKDCQKEEFKPDDALKKIKSCIEAIEKAKKDIKKDIERVKQSYNEKILELRKQQKENLPDNKKTKIEEDVALNEKNLKRVELVDPMLKSIGYDNNIDMLFGINKLELAKPKHSEKSEQSSGQSGVKSGVSELFKQSDKEFKKETVELFKVVEKFDGRDETIENIKKHIKAGAYLAAENKVGDGILKLMITNQKFSAEQIIGIITNIKEYLPRDIQVIKVAELLNGTTQSSKSEKRKSSETQHSALFHAVNRYINSNSNDNLKLIQKLMEYGAEVDGETKSLISKSKLSDDQQNDLYIKIKEAAELYTLTGIREALTRGDEAYAGIFIKRIKAEGHNINRVCVGIPGDVNTPAIHGINDINIQYLNAQGIKVDQAFLNRQEAIAGRLIDELGANIHIVCNGAGAPATLQSNIHIADHYLLPSTFREFPESERKFLVENKREDNSTGYLINHQEFYKKHSIDEGKIKELHYNKQEIQEGLANCEPLKQRFTKNSGYPMMRWDAATNECYNIVPYELKLIKDNIAQGREKEVTSRWHTERAIALELGYAKEGEKDKFGQLPNPLDQVKDKNELTIISTLADAIMQDKEKFKDLTEDLAHPVRGKATVKTLRQMVTHVLGGVEVAVNYKTDIRKVSSQELLNDLKLISRSNLKDHPSGLVSIVQKAFVQANEPVEPKKDEVKIEETPTQPNIIENVRGSSFISPSNLGGSNTQIKQNEGLSITPDNTGPSQTFRNNGKLKINDEKEEKKKKEEKEDEDFFNMDNNYFSDVSNYFNEKSTTNQNNSVPGGTDVSSPPTTDGNKEDLRDKGDLVLDEASRGVSPMIFEKDLVINESKSSEEKQNQIISQNEPIEVKKEELIINEKKPKSPLEVFRTTGKSPGAVLIELAFKGNNLPFGEGKKKEYYAWEGEQNATQGEKLRAAFQNSGLGGAYAQNLGSFSTKENQPPYSIRTLTIEHQGKDRKEALIGKMWEEQFNRVIGAMDSFVQQNKDQLLPKELKKLAVEKFTYQLLFGLCDKVRSQEIKNGSPLGKFPMEPIQMQMAFQQLKQVAELEIRTKELKELNEYFSGTGTGVVDKALEVLLYGKNNNIKEKVPLQQFFHVIDDPKLTGSIHIDTAGLKRYVQTGISLPSLSLEKLWEVEKAVKSEQFKAKKVNGYKLQIIASTMGDAQKLAGTSLNKWKPVGQNVSGTYRTPEEIKNGVFNQVQFVDDIYQCTQTTAQDSETFRDVQQEFQKSHLNDVRKTCIPSLLKSNNPDDLYSAVALSIMAGGYDKAANNSYLKQLAYTGQELTFFTKKLDGEKLFDELVKEAKKHFKFKDIKELRQAAINASNLDNQKSFASVWAETMAKDTKAKKPGQLVKNAQKVWEKQKNKGELKIESKSKFKIKEKKEVKPEVKSFPMNFQVQQDFNKYLADEKTQELFKELKISGEDHETLFDREVIKQKIIVPFYTQYPQYKPKNELCYQGWLDEQAKLLIKAVNQKVLDSVYTQYSSAWKDFIENGADKNIVLETNLMGRLIELKTYNKEKQNLLEKDGKTEDVDRRIKRTEESIQKIKESSEDVYNKYVKKDKEISEEGLYKAIQNNIKQTLEKFYNYKGNKHFEGLYSKNIDRVVDKIEIKGENNLLDPGSPRETLTNASPKLTYGKMKSLKIEPSEVSNVFKDIGSSIKVTYSLTPNVVNKIIVSFTRAEISGAGDFKRQTDSLRDALIVGSGLKEKEALEVVKWIQETIPALGCVEEKVFESKLKEIFKNKNAKNKDDILNNKEVMQWMITETKVQHQLLKEFSEENVSNITWGDKERRNVVMQKLEQAEKKLQEVSKYVENLKLSPEEEKKDKLELKETPLKEEKEDEKSVDKSGQLLKTDMQMLDTLDQLLEQNETSADDPVSNKTPGEGNNILPTSSNLESHIFGDLDNLLDELKQDKESEGLQHKLNLNIIYGSTGVTNKEGTPTTLEDIILGGRVDLLENEIKNKKIQGDTNINGMPLMLFAVSMFSDDLAPKQRLECVRLLCDAGVNVNAVNRSGNTALHIVLDNNSTENGFSEEQRLACTKMLCGVKDINVNAVDNEGQTPLHIAAASGNIGIIKLLLEKGAKLDTKDNEKNTPLDLAKEKEVKELLEKHKEPVKTTVKVEKEMPSSSVSYVTQNLPLNDRNRIISSGKMLRNSGVTPTIEGGEEKFTEKKFTVERKDPFSREEIIKNLKNEYLIGPGDEKARTRLTKFLGRYGMNENEINGYIEKADEIRNLNKQVNKNKGGAFLG